MHRLQLKNLTTGWWRGEAWGGGPGEAGGGGEMWGGGTREQGAQRVWGEMHRFPALSSLKT